MFDGSPIRLRPLKHPSILLNLSMLPSASLLSHSGRLAPNLVLYVTTDAHGDSLLTTTSIDGRTKHRFKPTGSILLEAAWSPFRP